MLSMVRWYKDKHENRNKLTCLHIHKRSCILFKQLVPITYISNHNNLFISVTKTLQSTEIDF